MAQGNIFTKIGIYFLKKVDKYDKCPMCAIKKILYQNWYAECNHHAVIGTFCAYEELAENQLETSQVRMLRETWEQIEVNASRAPDCYYFPQFLWIRTEGERFYLCNEHSITEVSPRSRYYTRVRTFYNKHILLPLENAKEEIEEII